MNDDYILEKSAYREGVFVLTDKAHMCVITFTEGDYNNTKKAAFVGEEPPNEGQKSYIIHEAEKWLGFHHADIAFGGEKFGIKFAEEDNHPVYFHNENPRWEIRMSFDCIHFPDEFIQSIEDFKQWAIRQEKERKERLEKERLEKERLEKERLEKEAREDQDYWSGESD